jgi:acetyl-CoA C-acetyltransferase
MSQPIFLVSGVRTAIGDFGGSLKDVAPTELGRQVVAEAIRRAGLEPTDVQHVVMGQVIPSEPRDAYLARVVAVNAGVPTSTPALTLNRLCGSSVEAIISAARGIALGEYDVAVAGGAESMSRSPHVLTSGRWGQRMGDGRLVDAMLETLNDPFGGFHMGVTAENVADRYSISRDQQDALAAESHRRAGVAVAEGRFKEQILPIEIKSRKGTVTFDTDEHVRTETTAESLAGLKPTFRKDGSVTAGNASGINDGAAAVVLASEASVKARNLIPMAKILGWGHAGVDPEVMGIGPVHAVPIALARAGLTIDQIDVIESNEAFAAQACAVADELGYDPAKVNPNGSGIGLGHPVGATGAIITVKAMYELRRTGGRYALVTMCIGGGQGIALVLERV